MPKALTITGLAVSALVLLVFLADLAVGIPFGKSSVMLDIGFMICAAILGYLAWTVYRELK